MPRPSRQDAGRRDRDDLTEVVAEMRRALGASPELVDETDTWKLDLLEQVIRHLDAR